MHRLLDELAEAILLEPVDEVRLAVRHGGHVGFGPQVKHLPVADEVLEFLSQHHAGKFTVDLLDLSVDRLELFLKGIFSVSQFHKTVRPREQAIHHASLLPEIISRHSSTTILEMSRFSARTRMIRSSTVPVAKRWKYCTFSAVWPARWMRALACS